MSKKQVDFFYKVVYDGGDGKKVPYEWKPGEFDEYMKVCGLVDVWGGIPLDVQWATATNSYQSALKKLKESNE